MNVSNRSCIRRLSIKSLKAAKSRNWIAILAIALTTVLFTSLFTIALSINHSMQQANFKQTGGYAHGTFKSLSWEQAQLLQEDPFIEEHGLRLLVGMAGGEPFNKAHVEVSYCDANYAKWIFAVPVAGRLPAEGTREAATDTRVLALLGVQPELGAEFTMSFNVDGKLTTETFTLSGWWDYDAAIMASHVLIPQSRAESIFDRLDTQGLDGLTNTWNMDVMFATSMTIEANMQTVLHNSGYQDQLRDDDNFLSTGVNWGYTGAQLSDNFDPITAVAIALLLIIIMVTGYLIIYNVFQISVTNDIRFYGLLKTIGTTGRQLRRIINVQALALSCLGIPLGLLVGYLVGVQLTPVILSQLAGVVSDAISTSPLIFIISAAFSLITVRISCRKPGKMAARVSAVEAVRYTEATGRKKTLRKAQTGASLPKMAWANLGRNHRKSVLTIVSLSLAVVLLNLTVTFTNGFDMDKYLRDMVSDYVIADANYFQVSGSLWNKDMAMPEDLIAEIQEQGGISSGGRTYGVTSSIQEFVTEEYYRSLWGKWNSKETLDLMLKNQSIEDGKLATSAQLYGMEQYALDKLNVLDGDISKLHEPGRRYIAAVYSVDDYGNAELKSHWARLGDTVTLRYVEEYAYYDGETGKLLDSVPDDGRNWFSKAKTYRDVEYEVAALVTVPSSLGYRYFGNDEFVLNDQTFIADTGTDSVMYYAFDAADEDIPAMEAFLQDLTNNRLTQYDYESKETYAQEFESFKSMFNILGSVLSFIIGLVGILNFLNAMLTGILARRREFAVLQSIGMTGKQLKTMLIWEGLYYTLGAVIVSLMLCVAVSPLLHTALESVFWFFSYRFTLLPVLAVAPIFAILGIVLPLVGYGYVARRSIVERLREAES